MDGEAGAQVAAHSVFLDHGRFHDPPSLAKKRSSAWQIHGLRRVHQQDQKQSTHPSDGNWNPKMWNWDSAGLTAKLVEQAKGDEGSAGSKGLEDGENLALKLGGVPYSAEQAVVRPNKKVRSGSPGTGTGTGGGGGYPMCQVDDCRANLSGAKDYHRRHKVCELHSKTTKAVVAKQLQRFCQQCSRFHPLSEFDEGKRSCRRRLAGHNRRRRKTQPEDAASRLLPLSNHGSNSNGNLDVANLLAILARLQGNGADKPACGPGLPDRDRLVQILCKINSLPAANPTLKLAAAAGLDLNDTQPSRHAPSEQSTKVNESPSVPSTMDLLAVLSAALAASAPAGLGVVSQGSGDTSGDGKTKAACAENVVHVSSHNKSAQVFPFDGAARNGFATLPQIEISKCPVQEVRSNLPFQLFNSSAKDDSPPKVDSSRKYFSSDSSNPMDDRSPSSSPPVTKKFFPLHSTEGGMKHGRQEIFMEVDNSTVEASTSLDWTAPVGFFKKSERRIENGTVQSLPYQAGYTSSSVSDHSPSSSNSDTQDRTGRILFKLFDKDPNMLPGTLRSQVLNWLSHSPSEIEGHIRPGCLVLSIYLSMPYIAWDELEKDFLQRVSSLVQCSESEFWRSGRFFVQTNRQMASHKDGKIRLCKSSRTWSAPELTSVTPVAVVSGQETTLLLRGRNLTVPGTKIHCTYLGGYMSKEVSGSAYPGTIYDDSSSESFSFPGGSPNIFGRCFVEVENGFKGNSFPVIIADAGICRELRAIESEFEEDRGTTDVISESPDQPRSRDDVLHFLHELGWLFQRKNASSNPFFIDFSCTRFKFLFTFSVERDWSAIVRTLLDMLVEKSLKGHDLLQESLELLLEIQLLSRAVKRKCRKMVNLLLHYSVKNAVDDSKMYLFPPNSAGPSGLTPLHLAASMMESEDIVDALTNDPQEISLRCWSTLKDGNGQSPFMYASMRNNHSYNRLVARKLVDRKNNQVSVMFGNEEILLDQSWIVKEPDKTGTQSLQVKSCARCAMMEAGRFRPIVRGHRMLHRPYFISMLAIAAVCVCVCLFLRGAPKIGCVAPFKWENLDFGPS